MIISWPREKTSFEEKYYNISHESASPYANPLLNRIEREGYLSIFKNADKDKLLPIGLSKILPSLDSCYFYTHSLLTTKSISRTIIGISSLISELPVEVLADELKRIKSCIHGDVFLFLSDNWTGKEEKLLSVLNLFMNSFGYVPNVIEFQTIGWSSHLKDASFYLLGQRWIFSDSFYRHLFLSKGAVEIELHPPLAGETVEEIKLSRNHSMFFVKIAGQKKEKFDSHDLISLQGIV